MKAKRMLLAVAAGIVGLASTSLLSLGCEDDDTNTKSSTPVDGGSGIPCEDSPTKCPKGETCWFTNTTASQFKCLRSGDAGVGEVCVAKPNTATCADGMLCLSTSTGNTTSESRCVSYCELDSGVDTCGPGTVCKRGDFASLTHLPICLPGTKDAGANDGG